MGFKDLSNVDTGALERRYQNVSAARLMREADRLEERDTIDDAAAELRIATFELVEHIYHAGALRPFNLGAV